MSRTPTRAELLAAADRRVPDVLAPGLSVVFCGINPGLYSAATGHHFARPGNRFWKVLHLAGFTARQLAPDEEDELLGSGIGVTNLVQRASATAAELTRRELEEGAAALRERLERFRPRCVAFLGMTAYRSAFAAPRATLGALAAPVAGVEGWLLPNPSGAQARYQLDELVALFSALRSHIADGDRPGVRRPPI